tara:strand:- start:397 stop:1368 length:972 start_codon:yes stop_codon:yes gene_type:complete
MKKYIDTGDRFYVAGHKGMAGSAICRSLKNNKYKNIIKVDRKELDLCDKESVHKWFNNNKPDIAVIAAARVGGIVANNSYPTEFLLDNMKIQNNIIEAAWKNKVKRILFLGSSCIYPKFCKQPMVEEDLLSGSLEQTNEWYALAKITGIKLCDALRKQYGFDAICLMPTNLYGIGDNYHKKDSHVIPGLIRRFHEAVLRKEKSVKCWGSGSPFREFLYVEDLGNACVFALENWKPKLNELNFLNVGSGNEISIKNLAQKISKVCGFSGEILWDTTKPNGTPRKLLDVSKFTEIGWKATTDLDTGLKKSYESFLDDIKNNKLRQ